VDYLPFPFDSGPTLFAHGRQALWEGVRRAGLASGDEILAPAFNCGSEIEALVQAELGVRFYETPETLEPIEEELESLVGSRTRALLLVHYLGFPQDSVKWRAWCRSRNLLLIEDCAHVWLAYANGRPVGSFGDIAIFSLSKTFGLPEGGVLVTGFPSSSETPAGRRGTPSLVKSHLASLATRVGWVPPEHRKPPGPVQQVEFIPGHPLAFEAPRLPSFSIRYLMRRLRPHEAAEIRRRNYRYLLDQCADRVPPPFREVVEGAAPLVFPIEAEDRPSSIGHFRRLGIAARPWWSFLHPLLPQSQLANAVAWRTRFLVLPVHQGLNEGDIERIAAALRAW
jgi:perosamine synthetase